MGEPDGLGLQWAVAERPILGARASGDAHLVREEAEGMLIAVVDGLGHGEDARAASATILDALQKAPRPDALEDLLLAAHRAGLHTRGAVASLAWIRPGAETMAWVGVGNVAGILLRALPNEGQRARVWLNAQRGVLGYRMPRVRVTDLELGPGDLLVLATDGISVDYPDELPASLQPRDLARDLLERHGRATDDALVWVGRVPGRAP